VIILLLEKINALSSNQLPITTQQERKQNIIWTATGTGKWMTTTNHQFFVSLDADTTTSQWHLVLSSVNDSGAMHYLQSRILTIDHQRSVFDLELKANLENSNRRTSWECSLQLIIALTCAMAAIIMTSNAFARKWFRYGHLADVVGQTTENDDMMADRPSLAGHGQFSNRSFVLPQQLHNNGVGDPCSMPSSFGSTHNPIHRNAGVQRLETSSPFAPLILYRPDDTIGFATNIHHNKVPQIGSEVIS
jgi:hypothetical protein